VRRRICFLCSLALGLLFARISQNYPSHINQNSSFRAKSRVPHFAAPAARAEQRGICFFSFFEQASAISRFCARAASTRRTICPQRRN